MLRLAIPSKDNKRIWWVYILTNARLNSSYTGVTTDVPRRLEQHNGILKGGSRTTRRGRPWTVIHLEGPLGKREAHRREYAIKLLSRERKLALSQTLSDSHATHEPECLQEPQQQTDDDHDIEDLTDPCVHGDQLDDPK